MWLLIGAALGGAAAGFWSAAKTRAGLAAESAALAAELAGLRATGEELRRRHAALETENRDLRCERDTERVARTASETRLDEQRRNLEEQRRLLAEAEKRLREAFAALSAESLRTNSEQFLRQAEERVRPLRESLERYEKQVKELESVRQSAYAGMTTRLDKVEQTHQLLHKETGRLVSALRTPQVRGQWGEMTLQRAVELAGMSPLCDFQTQETSDGAAGRQRPDLIVRLAGDRKIVVDSKTPLASYLDAMAVDDAEARRVKFLEHARSVRKHVDDLSSKAYASRAGDTPEFVVMYLPGEAFFSAAVIHDPTLIDHAVSKGIVLASPTTLIALLRAAAYGWQQHRMAENAARIAEAGRELFERIVTFMEHFERIGEGLKRSGEAFNSAVSSFERRVAPQGRRMAELGVVPEAQELPAPKPVDAQPIADSMTRFARPGDAA